MHSVRVVLPFLTAAVLMMAVVGCDRPSSQAGPVTAAAQAASQPAVPSVGVVASGFAPVTYFQDHCARCHGPYGEYYPAGLGQRRSVDELRQAVLRMADGPGAAPLEPRQAELVATFLHHATQNRPFVLVTQMTGGGGPAPVQLTGEVAPPGKTVTIRTPQQTSNAQVTEHAWTASLPAGTDPAKVAVSVE